MRLLVRATTIRAPAGPEQPRIYAVGQDRDAGAATAAIAQDLTASGSDSDQGYAEWSNPSTETAIGRDRDAGSGTYLPDRGINYGRDADRGTGTVLRLFPGTDRDRGYASASFRAIGRDGDRGSAVPTPAIAYAYAHTLVIERMNDLAAQTIANHVAQLYLIDTWLKQSNLTGGRIRNANCYDLIFETTASVRLDHEIAAYDGTAGRLDFALRLPSWALAADQFIFRVRYGATL